MRSRRIDFSLLAALDALVTEKSVSRAASRLHMSQPAMSHALARLRDAFDDPILVRAQGGMVPTSKALRILEPTRTAVTNLETSLAGFRHLDLATDRSIVRIGVVDYVELMVLPHFAPVLREAAPGLRLLVRPLVSGLDLTDDLVGGKLDVALAFFPKAAQALRRQRLGEENYVCIAARGRWKPGTFSKEDYLAARHLVVSPTGEFQTPGLDGMLKRRGLAREVVYSTSHFSMAAAIVEKTDLVATIQGGLASRMAREFAIDVLPLPVGPSQLVLSQIWHERTHKDPLLHWVRARMADACREALAPAADAPPVARVARRKPA